jgi:hypothetical protein
MERPITVNDVVIFFGSITFVPALILWNVSGLIDNAFTSICYWLVYGLIIYAASFATWLILAYKS